MTIKGPRHSVAAGRAVALLVRVRGIAQAVADEVGQQVAADDAGLPHAGQPRRPFAQFATEPGPATPDPHARGAEGEAPSGERRRRTARRSAASRRFQTPVLKQSVQKANMTVSNGTNFMLVDTHESQPTTNPSPYSSTRRLRPRATGFTARPHPARSETGPG